MRQTEPTSDIYLTENETADRLKLSTRTLQRWRQEGRQGLPFRRFGGLVRYSLNDIEAWAAQRSFISTSQAA
jgi:excisionase family DNA binding protein